MQVQHRLGLLLLLGGLVSCQSGGNTPAGSMVVASAVATAGPTMTIATIAPMPTFIITTVAVELSPTPAVSAASFPTAFTTTVAPTSQPAQTVAPSVPATATSVPPPTTPVDTAAPGGVIFFVDTDGATIKTIHPDGTNEFVLVRQPGVKTVSDLAADPSGTYLLFSGDGVEYLVQRGQAKPIAPFVGRPRWAPDGRRFVAAQSQGNSWHLFVYDTRAGSGQMLAVAGLQPDWFPDNQRLVYVDQGNVWSYDLRSNSSKQLTQLPTAQAAAWAVQSPHVLPDGQHILFFGGLGSMLGASGNGQQWWSIPAGGGQPQPWTDLGTNIGGNGVLDYGVAPQGDALAWSEGAHASACESDESVTVSSTAVEGNSRLTRGLAELDPKRGPLQAVLGLSWAPDNNRLALALQPYDCNPAGHPTPDPVTGRPNTGPSKIFIWNVRPNNTLGPFVLPTPLVNGSYPVWTH